MGDVLGHPHEQVDVTNLAEGGVMESARKVTAKLGEDYARAKQDQRNTVSNHARGLHEQNSEPNPSIEPTQ